jgi:hypothetical protein
VGACAMKEISEKLIKKLFNKTLKYSNKIKMDIKERE